MKHIGLFENFESEDFYKCISSEYFYQLLGSQDHNNYQYQNTTQLSESDKNEIKKVYCDESDKMITKKVDGKINQLYPNKHIKFHTDEESAYVICLYETNLLGMTKILDNQNILKLEDEWFLVYCRGSATGKTRNLFFKCDQIDGLVKCLEDNKMKVSQFRPYKAIPK
jgi:hypothetical protein